MSLYGICLVKDESDIIGESLSFAARYCEQIFVIDNGSTDGTWDIVQALASQSSTIVPFEQTLEPFDIGMRSRVYNTVHRDLSDEDWWLILDADEFLAEDPRPVIDGAAHAGADTVRTWQIQFYLTERDAEEYERGNGDRDKSIFDPRREGLNYGLVLAVFAIFGLYVGAMPWLGFRISTFLFVGALQATLEPPRGARGWAVVGITALATAAASYFLFERYLQVLLPRGRWTDF
jgi:glycosyltransferase involved in cell wall biosynthesis